MSDPCHLHIILDVDEPLVIIRRKNPDKAPVCSHQDSWQSWFLTRLGIFRMSSPSLPPRQAILFGWATKVPTLVVEVGRLQREQRQLSDDPRFWDSWTGAETTDSLGCCSPKLDFFLRNVSPQRMMFLNQALTLGQQLRPGSEAR